MMKKSLFRPIVFLVFDLVFSVFIVCFLSFVALSGKPIGFWQTTALCCVLIRCLIKAVNRTRTIKRTFAKRKQSGEQPTGQKTA